MTVTGFRGTTGNAVHAWLGTQAVKDFPCRLLQTLVGGLSVVRKGQGVTEEK